MGRKIDLYSPINFRLSRHDSVFQDLTPGRVGGCLQKITAHLCSVEDHGVFPSEELRCAFALGLKIISNSRRKFMVSTIDRAALGRQRVTPRFRDSWVLPIAQTTCFCVVPFEWIIDLCTRVLMIAQSFWREGPLPAALARLVCRTDQESVCVPWRSCCLLPCILSLSVAGRARLRAAHRGTSLTEDTGQHSTFRSPGGVVGLFISRNTNVRGGGLLGHSGLIKVVNAPAPETPVPI